MASKNNKERKRSIFRAIFIPIIGIMVLQSIILYMVAVYGGIETSLNQNAVDILSEQLTNKTNEIANKFNTEWADLNDYEEELSRKYEECKVETNATYPFTADVENQLNFLSDNSDMLVTALRNTNVNGIFLMLNNNSTSESFIEGRTNKIYGVHIRDMDQNTSYTGREDLLIERAPSSIVDGIGCSLDSWWEAQYSFDTKEEGDFFYNPIDAAWKNKGVDSDDLAYFSGTHSLDENGEKVISYTIPLIDEEGYPYGVLGVELTEKYISTLLSGDEIGTTNDGCYILGTLSKKNKCIPSVSSGVFFNSSFSAGEEIDCSEVDNLGGFRLEGRRNKEIYGIYKNLEIYNNNNPFENQMPIIVAMVDEQSLFAYSLRIKLTLLWVTVFSLILGIIAILIVSRGFSNPIKALAAKARKIKSEKDSKLEHLGIIEIDQLVDSIEVLSKNVNKENARTEFFSRMSHDMRTPMNAIISFSSKEFTEGSDEKTKQEYLDKINSSGEYLLGLINEVLDMTKIESNKVSLKAEVKPVEDLWDGVIPMVNELAEDKGVEFERKISFDEGLYVAADIQHINQIAMNLLSNAVKFTPAGKSVLLDIVVSELDEDRVNVRMIVADSGIGMSEEFQKKVFTPFEQEHSDIGGTGLGLSICKQLTELMNGTIVFTSKENVGTTFEVNIPLDKGLADDAMPSDNNANLEAENVDVILKGRRVLLCEDHPVNAQIATRLLEKKGIIVDYASNGEEGVKLFESTPEGYYDAILMDIRMPVMNGLEAAVKIRNLDRADVKNIPIIAMTANAFTEDEENSRRAGMNAHLSKPVVPNLMYETLAEFINNHDTDGI